MALTPTYTVAADGSQRVGLQLDMKDGAIKNVYSINGAAPSTMPFGAYAVVEDSSSNVAAANAGLSGSGNVVLGPGAAGTGSGNIILGGGSVSGAGSSNILIGAAGSVGAANNVWKIGTLLGGSLFTGEMDVSGNIYTSGTVESRITATGGNTSDLFLTISDASGTSSWAQYMVGNDPSGFGGADNTAPVYVYPNGSVSSTRGRNIRCAHYALRDGVTGAAGLTELAGDISFYNAVQFGEDTYTAGNAHIMDDADVSGNLHLTGTAYFNSLIAAGTGSFGADADVSGNLHLTGTAFSSGLQVAGYAGISNDADISGNLYLMGTAFLTSPHISGTANLAALQASSTAYIGGTLTAGSDADVSGNLHLVGNADVSGNLVLTGVISRPITSASYQTYTLTGDQGLTTQNAPTITPYSVGTQVQGWGSFSNSNSPFDTTIGSIDASGSVWTCSVAGTYIIRTNFIASNANSNNTNSIALLTTLNGTATILLQYPILVCSTTAPLFETMDGTYTLTFAVGDSFAFVAWGLLSGADAQMNIFYKASPTASSQSSFTIMRLW